MVLERARKKSAKQLLEDKQIKRYLRSRKRSQKRKHVCLDKDNIGNQKRETLFSKTTKRSNTERTEMQVTCDNYSEEKFERETNLGKIEDKKSQNGSESQSKEHSKVAPNISKKITKEKELTQSISKENEGKQQNTTDNNMIEQNIKAKSLLEIISNKKVQPFGEHCKTHENEKNEGDITSDPDEETLTEHEENITYNDVETGYKDKEVLLDIENIWTDKYKYEDAEKQFYLQMERNSGNGNEVFSDCMILDYKIKENNLKVQKDVTAKVVTKPRVAYEIIEEIVERTEITYHLVKQKADTEHMDDKIKIRESGSSEVDKYLSDLDSYVKSLGSRVKILEEGKKKDERESDKVADTTGKNTTAYNFDHMNIINKMKQRCEKDIPQMSRIM